MHARFCSPGTGRFLSVDPAEERQALKRPQKWNRYAYVENNPLAFVDPDGEESVGITQDILLQARLRGGITPEEHRAALAARAIGASVGAAGAFAILAVPGTAALFGAGELLVPVAPVVSNPNLQRVVRELFKSSDRLPGGTAGALRSEALTGRMLSRSPTGHIQAGLERLGRLRAVLTRSGLSTRDTDTALRLQRDLENQLRNALRRQGFTPKQIQEIVTSGRFLAE